MDIGLEGKLDAIGKGDASPAEATISVRAGLRAGMSDRVYERLRDFTWHAIASKFVPELAAWYDLVSHAAVLASRAGDEALRHRLETLCDLLGQSSRFADLQPMAEVAGRKHVVEILAVLSSAGGRANRAYVSRALRLSDANLSRVLTIMSSAGLLSRSRSGKEAVFGLTEAGTSVLRLRNGREVLERSDERLRQVIQAMPVPVCVFDRDGAVVARNVAFAGGDDHVDVEGGFRQAPIDRFRGASTLREGASESGDRVVVGMAAASVLSGGATAFPTGVATPLDHAGLRSLVGHLHAGLLAVRGGERVRSDATAASTGLRSRQRSARRVGTMLPSDGSETGRPSAPPTGSEEMGNGFEILSDDGNLKAIFADRRAGYGRIEDERGLLAVVESFDAERLTISVIVGPEH